MSYQNASNNPNIPCLCALQSAYGVHQEMHYPRSTPYSKAVAHHGAYKTPDRRYQPPRFNGSTEYIDVHGKRKEIDLNYPYALVIYEPQPLERYFQTKERAVCEVPRCGHWEIIYLPTGQIVYEPSTH